MNIIVCVKSVPDTNEVKINKETNTIIRDGLQAIINPFDTYAIEEGLRIKEKMGGKVTAISMGIPSTANLLKDTIAMGVDEAVLLSDKAFAGADTLATSYALSMGIRNIGEYDLIICGKQAVDGDTAQIGPSLAEKLDIPHTTYVTKIENIRKDFIRCWRLTEDGHEVIEMSLPAVITVVKDINEPRLATIKGMIRAKNISVTLWNADDIHADKSLCGITGSPTRVVETFVPIHQNQSTIIEGTPQEQAKKIADKLLAMQIITCK